MHKADLKCLTLVINTGFSDASVCLDFAVHSRMSTENCGLFIKSSLEALRLNAEYTAVSSRIASTACVTLQRSQELTERFPDMTTNSVNRPKGKSNGTSLLNMEREIVNSHAWFEDLMFYTVQKMSTGVYVRYIAKGV